MNHANKFVKSYYDKHCNDLKNSDFVNNLVSKDWVYTGEVDLWRGLNFNDNYIDVGKDDNYFQSFKHGDLTIEAGKNKTNFMSITRIELCMELVNLLYIDIIKILNEYIETSQQFKEEEEIIVDLWDTLYLEGE